MKLLVSVVFLAMILCNGAHAAQPRVIAQYHALPGYTLTPKEIWLSLTSDGEVVVSTLESVTGRRSTAIIARLNAKSTVALERGVSTMPEGPLVDRQVGAPECADVPIEQWMVYPNEQTRVFIAKAQGCHEYTYESSDSGAVQLAQKVRTLLDGLLALYQAVDEAP